MSDSAGSMDAVASTQAAGAATGLFRSLKNLAATFLALAQTRMELLTTELREEVQRAAALFVWAFVALLAGIVGLFFGGLTIVLFYWDSHRILAALLVTSAFVGLAALAVTMLIVKINSRPRFLDATLTELAKDASSLKSEVAK